MRFVAYSVSASVRHDHLFAGLPGVFRHCVFLDVNVRQGRAGRPVWVECRRYCRQGVAEALEELRGRKRGSVAVPCTYSRPVGRWNHRSRGTGKKTIMRRSSLTCSLSFAVVPRYRASLLLSCWRFQRSSVVCMLLTSRPIGLASSL